MTSAADTLPVVHHRDGYCLEPVDAVADERIGPYQTKAAAESDRWGVLRFIRRENVGKNPFE